MRMLRLVLMGVCMSAMAMHGRADTLPTIGFTTTVVLASDNGVARRDPSDVIKVGDTYYVWYTKVVDAPGIWAFPSGYSGDLFYATSNDGKRFVEQGLAVGKGDAGAWDEHGVFTPNILKWQGKYYLYYTGVPTPFGHETPTAIGVAIADSPDGPWVKFKRNPVLEPDAEHPEAFDSMRIDDASLLVRGGHVWLYYKGRCVQHGRAGPGKTRMGVAIAGMPTGPFVRSDANPLHRGHEVVVWPQDGGIMSMATNAGPRQIYFAADGLTFQPRYDLKGGVGAPGIYRVDDFEDRTDGPPPQWGVCMDRGQGESISVVRFDMRVPDE